MACDRNKTEHISISTFKVPQSIISYLITYSAVILYADWSICRFTIQRQNSIFNGGIQNFHLATSLVLTSKVILKFYEMYLLFLFLSMK